MLLLLSLVFEGFLARTRGSDACKPNILQKYRPASLQTYEYRRVACLQKLLQCLLVSYSPLAAGFPKRAGALGALASR